MSNSNEGSDLMKRCSRCGINSLKSNFLEKKTEINGLTQHCKPCRKIYRKKIYNEHYDLEINRRRNYRIDKKEKINDYNKKRRLKVQISL